MKKYYIKIKGKEIEIIQDDDNKFIKPNFIKKFELYGSALKPSFEPIIVARKPFKGSLVDNVIKNGVGGINIDECRIEFNGDKWKNQKSGNTAKAFNLNEQQREAGTGVLAGYECKANDNGRFPANTILTYDETDFEEVCGRFPNTKSTYNSETKHENIIHRDNADFLKYGYKTRIDSSSYNDNGNASRYFYCAKASKRDRDEGLDDFEEVPLTLTENKGRTFNDRCAICGKKFIGPPEKICHCENPITDKTKSAPRKNIHPTVKPTSLMQYLVRLVTPNNGIILDPFNGSGSTGKAVMYENKERNKNYKYIGIEMTEEYLPISKARIEYVYNQIKDSKVQISIDDME